MAFAQRIIDLRFILGKGDFGFAESDTVDIKGLRVSASITKAGTVSNADCELRVWGMPLELMDKLTILNKLAYGEQIDNTVVVSAGDHINGVSVVFQGTIQEAWAEGRNPPDVMFYVRATSGMFRAMQPIPPTSYSGSVEASIALRGLAEQMGLQLVNDGVTGQIRNPYWPGTAKQQLEKMCHALDCIPHVDDVTHTLHVWPRGGSKSEQAVLLSAETGLVGYPTYTQNGLAARSMYNPNLSFGRKVNVQSQFKPASGEWVVAAISHNLDSIIPDGEWFTEIQCSLPDAPLAIIG